MTEKQYARLVDELVPQSPIWKDCINAFWVGGLICSIGQMIFEICKIKGLPIAVYDDEKECAYLEYPDGKKVYVKD